MGDDLLLKMILDESGFTTGMNKAVNTLDRFDDHIGKTSDKGGRDLGSIWKTFAGNLLAGGALKVITTGMNLIKDSVSGAISRVDTLKNANRVFENMGFSAQDTSSTMDALKASIQGLPTPLDSAVKGVQLIASSTEDLGKSQEIFAALNNGILGFGGSAEQVDNAVTQLSQSFSNGKVDAETWNSMIDAGLGPALNALAKQMGKTSGELKKGLSEGSISVGTFQDALIDLNKNGGGGLKSLETIAKDATAGIGTGLQNAKTGIVRGVGNVINAVDEVLKNAKFGGIGNLIAQVGEKFEGFLNLIADNIPTAIETITNLYDKLEPFLPVIFGLVSAFTIYQGVMKTAKTAVAAYNAVQATMNALMNANPIGLVVTAIVMAVGAFIYFWNTSEEFRNFWIGLWESIKETVSKAVEGIKKAWEGIKEFFSTVWQGLKDGAVAAVEGIKNTWQGIKDWFSQLWTSVKETFALAWEAIKNTVMMIVQPFIDGFMNLWNGMSTGLSLIWTGIQQIAQGAWEFIKNIILAPVLMVVDLVTGDFSSMASHLSQIWENIKQAASNIWNGFKTMLSGIVQTVVGFVQAQFENLKNILSAVWTNIVNTGKSLFEGLKNTLSNIVESIKSTFVNVWNSIWSTLIGIFYGIVGAAQGAWNNLKQGVSDAVNRVKSIFESLRNINLFEIGKNIIQGLINGIGSMVDKVKNKISEIGNGIKSKITGVLGIKSPSRWMRDMVGKNIVEGIVVGINQTQSKLDNTMENLVATPEVTPRVQPVPAGGYGQVSPAANPTSVESTEIHLTVNAFGNLPEATVNDLAKQLSTKIQTLMQREKAAIGG